MQVTTFLSMSLRRKRAPAARYRNGHSMLSIGRKPNAQRAFPTNSRTAATNRRGSLVTQRPSDDFARMTGRRSEPTARSSEPTLACASDCARWQPSRTRSRLSARRIFGALGSEWNRKTAIARGDLRNLTAALWLRAVAPCHHDVDSISTLAVTACEPREPGRGSCSMAEEGRTGTRPNLQELPHAPAPRGPRLRSRPHP